MSERSMESSAKRRIAALLAVPLSMPLAHGAWAASTVNAQGQQGLTSYVTLPFMSSIYQTSWGSSPYMSPGNLFWQSGSWFTNKLYMAEAQNAAKSLTATGIVPSSGSQRWADTFEISQAASLFPGEPAYIASDRSSGVASGPEFQAWAQWIRARPNLPIMASDGGSEPQDMRAYNSSWGHISPLMPLAPGDCPTGMASCVYGDLYAYQWGQTAALSGAYGVMLSDFSDSQPGQISTQMGFNPEIVAAFAAAENVSVPAGTVAQQSTWIVSHAMTQWNDYLDLGYAKFFGALSSRLSTATSQPALVVDQSGGWASQHRFLGVDPRLFAGSVASANYVCIWDDQTMQVGRTGEDPAYGVGGYAIAAAREPDVRNGANLEANDAAYWQAIAAFNPTLGAADQQEKGLKLLKRSWLEASWAHVATRQGQVRRALAFVQRDYWDWGTIDPTLSSLISSIVPTAPFGFGVYYSVAAERALEPVIVIQTPTFNANAYVQAYYNPDFLLNLKNAGVPVGYYVSDAALSSLTPAAAPAAWIILEHPELIPASEMAALTKVAPVLTTTAQVQAFANAPLSFTGGLTGTGFYDQYGRLIVTATNPSAANTSGFMKLKGLRDGPWIMQDLFTGQHVNFTSVGGVASIPLGVTRWDTLAYGITPL